VAKIRVLHALRGKNNRQKNHLNTQKNTILEIITNIFTPGGGFYTGNDLRPDCSKK